MSIVELVPPKIFEGKEDTGATEVPDKATHVIIELKRPESRDAFQKVDGAPKGSPMHWELQVSLDRGRTWVANGGGNIKGGNWVTLAGLQRENKLNASLPAGTRRLARVVYECRTRMPVHVFMHFKAIADGRIS